MGRVLASAALALALALGAAGSAAAASSQAAGLRFFSYWAALTSFIALFVIYKRFLKRMDASGATPVTARGFCPSCGTPHKGDAFCGGCGAAITPPGAPTAAAPATPGGGGE